MCATIINNILSVDQYDEWRRINESELPNEAEWQQFMYGDFWALERGYEGGMEMATTGRSLPITQGGRMGLCNPNSQPGDDVWALFGSKVPFVLRKVPKRMV
jgi:hypothetical protein